jgi:hypothetical protein
MEKDLYVTIYTADDEEPNCNRCDNIMESIPWCGRNCGAEHGWNGYQRTEKEWIDRKEQP